jgi:hypothetical protein
MTTRSTSTVIRTRPCSARYSQALAIKRYIHGVSAIFSVTDASQPRFGFVSFAETWNGRLAMLGFVIGLATEVLTGQGILSQIGLG